MADDDGRRVIRLPHDGTPGSDGRSGRDKPVAVLTLSQFDAVLPQEVGLDRRQAAVAWLTKLGIRLFGEGGSPIGSADGEGIDGGSAGRIASNSGAARGLGAASSGSPTIDEKRALLAAVRLNRASLDQLRREYSATRRRILEIEEKALRRIALMKRRRDPD